ncbi:hypothetical protein O6A27_27735 [Escherichia coli]|nr:hypothetical protein [Escherichia coli]
MARARQNVKGVLPAASSGNDLLLTLAFGLLPVEITPDEQKEPVAAIAPSFTSLPPDRVSAGSCGESVYGHMALENPSPELLAVLIR